MHGGRIFHQSSFTHPLSQAFIASLFSTSKLDGGGSGGVLARDGGHPQAAGHQVRPEFGGRARDDAVVVSGTAGLPLAPVAGRLKADQLRTMLRDATVERLGWALAFTVIS